VQEAVSDSGICENCGKIRAVNHLSVLRTGNIPCCNFWGVAPKLTAAFFRDVIDEQKRQRKSRVLEGANVLLLVGTNCTVDSVMSLALKFK
jgi:NAD-dependent SIR2 family protein deacetylase